jgi:hypothetical protein
VFSKSDSRAYTIFIEILPVYTQSDYLVGTTVPFAIVVVRELVVQVKSFYIVQLSRHPSWATPIVLSHGKFWTKPSPQISRQTAGFIVESKAYSGLQTEQPSHHLHYVQLTSHETHV